jgi:hypothetical protein
MNRLALFARWPEPGRVKTRLSPSLPPDLACGLYRAMLSDALAAGSRVTGAERLVYWAEAPAPPAAAQAAPSFEPRPQRGADLGERLTSAFDDMLAAPGDRAVVIGADCPDLDAPLIREAFAALEAHALVLGPANDGGYYLIGLSRRAPGIFRAIEWGSERVFEQTLAAARSEGLGVALLGGLADIDTPADLVRLIARRIGTGRSAPSHTDGALRHLGFLPPAGAAD